MKRIDVNKLKKQTQDFVLRLFVESSGVFSTPTDSDYYCTCSHVGTHARLHS